MYIAKQLGYRIAWHTGLVRILGYSLEYELPGLFITTHTWLFPFVYSVVPSLTGSLHGHQPQV